jgi:hypothetical protein
MFWLITSFGFLVPLFFLSKDLFTGYLTAYLLTRVLITIASHQNIIENLGFIIPLQISMGIFIYKAFTNKYFGKFLWKGRSIK